MAVVAQPWENAKKILAERLDSAKRARFDNEGRWSIVDAIMYGGEDRRGQGSVLPSSGGSVVSTGLIEDVDNTPSNISVLYAMKNLRFIHSQLSTNAPAVAIKPTSSDAEDLRRADAADRLVRYGLRQYRLQEIFDICGNDTLHYGSGFIKTKWNPEIGEILDCSEEGLLSLAGDFEAEVVSPKMMFIDPDANTWDKVRYVFEKKVMPYEAALYLLGEGKKEILEQHRKKNYADESGKEKFDVVILYEYWETGLPYNGYAGRYCLCGEDGTPLSEVHPNPYAFGKAGNKRLKKARLPYHMLTDIDKTGSVWGVSFLDFVIRPQDVLNRLDSVVLDNLEVHAVYRMILPEGCEISDESITNTPKEVIKITGSQPPHYMQPPQLAPDLSRYREMLKQGIDELSGVNEAMFGIQNRETAGTAMQYSVNQGSQIRKRLFNKLALMTESVYKDYLDIIRENWVIERHIAVLGKENALEASDIKGADIDGGYDVTIEYGTSLPIDPMTRRQEIINYMPLFEKAGVSSRSLLRLMKLNDLSGYYDEIERAKNRQREYFEEMNATGVYIEPQVFEDHENMIVFCKEYIMSQEFKELAEKTKLMIRKHIVDRAGMPAKEATLLGQANAPAPIPGAVPEMPMSPGMPAETAPAGALPPLGM